MTYQHQSLAAGRWKALSFFEQMANVGSEVERALNWRQKNNPEYARRATDRALELMDFTLDSVKGPARKEVARTREVLVDYFYGTNEYGSTDASWRSYFGHFLYAARRMH